MLALGFGLGLDRRKKKGKWTPSQIITALWVDASDAKTITENETVPGNVAQIDDKSGNNRHVSQSVEINQPTYANNKITFNGTSDYLFNASPFMYAAGEVDIYFLGSVAGIGGQAIISESNNSNTNPLYQIVENSIGPDFKLTSSIIRNDISVIQVNHSVLNANNAFNDTDKIINCRDSGNNIDCYIDGVAGNNVSYTRSGVLTLNRFSIGALVRTSVTSYADMDIKEIVILPSIASTTERQKIEGYLAHKWGLTANLPVNHPYKTNKPY